MINEASEFKLPRVNTRVIKVFYINNTSKLEFTDETDDDDNKNCNITKKIYQNERILRNQNINLKKIMLFLEYYEY